MPFNKTELAESVLQAIKDFEQKFVGSAKLSAATRSGKAERVVRGYLQSDETTKDIVRAFDASEGTTFDKQLTDLGMKREWNPRDTDKSRELAVWLFRMVQKIPLIKPLPIAKTAARLSGPLGPAAALGGQATSQYIANPNE